jgi:hypothetical protein
MKKENIYAIYKGDEFIFMGTKKECAEHLGVKPEAIKFYSTPTYRKRSKSLDNNRTVVIKVEDIED